MYHATIPPIVHHHGYRSQQGAHPRRGVDYRGKIVLAPMVRSGELPSRLVALKYGADLVWGPETVDRSMIGTTRRVNDATGTIEWTRQPSNGQKAPPEHATESTIYKMHPAKEGEKLIFQMGTSDPERAVACARLVAADVAGIDVNAGYKLCAILEALVRDIVPEFEIGISVKIRILDTAAETETLVRRLCATGITGLTVHCRTTPMRPRERAIRGQLRMIADVCREAGVACLMNGDVTNRDEGLKLAEEFGVDGAMIATAAEKNPSCFRSQADGGLAPWREAVEEYVKLAMEVENKYGNTKFLLANMVPGKQVLHGPITQCRSHTQVCQHLDFSHLLEKARAADMALELGEFARAPRKKDKKANAAALAAGGNMAQARKASKTTDNKLAQPNRLAQPAQAAQTETSLPVAEPPLQPAVAASSM
ncbi:unnamed protein product [Parascedosporium putredinis]|uniref:DUS-like FMN-binding domain-containing protein n=1 Tax=Parascedosporium putredinis TaxID=1442378 RepID=A0A9P1MAX9_9PEZI|nr:unnamed protein product [Parascedosporium putredinis]CAI7998486.1 unnamed protein product [Parascedosporium putredinis]